jgi:hypothetical protein
LWGALLFVGLRDFCSKPFQAAIVSGHLCGHAESAVFLELVGQRYRSLSVVAERITGAHWSGPRFFGLTKRAGRSVGTEAGR